MADVDAAMTVLRYKSAKYSIERPLHIGATLAGGGDPRSWSQLSAFGLPLGEAFQLRDDLLGVFGDPDDDRQAGGRRPGRGQAHRPGRAGPGRRLGRRRGPARRRARHAAVGGRRSTELRRIIDDSGAHAQVEQVIGELAGRATDALARADLDARARDVLLELATAATVRAV